MEKQKILVIANGIFGKDPGLSGGDVRFLEIVRRWHESGHEIHLLSSKEAEDVCGIFGFKPIMHVIPGPAECNRITFITRAFQACLWSPAQLVGFNEGIIYSVNDSVFDSVPAWRIKLSLREKVKWAAVVHWLPPFPPWKRRKSTIMNSILFYVNERISIILIKFFADIALAVSDSTARQLVDFGLTKSKIVSVKCGVNFSEIRRIVSRIKIKKYEAIFMKRAQPVKGVFDFIKIWKRVIEVYPKAKLLIAGGEGGEEELLKQEIARAGLAKNIRSVGYLHSFKEKFTYMGQSRVFVLPSYEENWAIVIGEAMASRIPVIAYGLRELKQVWQSRVLWTSVGDTDKFAEAIITLLKSSKQRIQMVRNGLVFIKSLDWKTIARQELEKIVN